MAKASVRGIDINYRLSGHGPRLLVFNGSGGSIESAALLVGRLADHFEVLIHDQRGLGATTIPAEAATMADYAADAAALLDHVGWRSCNVFGISFGGMVAQEYAVTSPGRVERLVLLCTSAGGGGGSSYPLHEMAELPIQERLAISRLNLDTRFTDDWLAEHRSDKAMAEFAAARALEPRTDEQRRGELLQLEARRHHDVWDRLCRISCPTLIQGGVFDGTAPPANSAAIHSRIAGSVLRYYVGGHGFMYQDERALADVIAFLNDEPLSDPAGDPVP